MAVLKFASAQSMSLAERYLSLGFALTPVELKSKKPLERGWQRNYYTDKSEANVFRDRNIGMVLGVDPLHAVDIDLDCREAIRLAPYFLPETDWVFGHASAKRSHYIYRCAGMETQRFASAEMILEIRSIGAQTVVPGSVHPSDEPVRFESVAWEKALPPSVEKGLLELACSRLAAASLILRDGWTEGTRDEVAVALCGAMLRSGQSVVDIDTFLESISLASGDEELDMRLKADYQSKRLVAGDRVPGIPSLIKWLGGDVTNHVLRWLGIQSSNVVNELNAELALVSMGGKVRVIVDGGPMANGSEVIPMSVSDCRQLYLNRGETKLGKRSVGKFDYWLQSPERRNYSRVVFKPNGCEEREYNLWRGWPLKPIAGGYARSGSNGDSRRRLGCQVFLDHVLNVICTGDRGLYEYVLSWLADAVRNPCDKPGVALVMQSSEEGTGKTIFAQYVMKMFGRYGSIVTNSEHLFSKHNFHLANKIMVFADESVWAGNHQHRGVLNSLITGETLSFEPKGVDSFNMDNHVHLIMATNQDWAVPASVTARRFCIMQVDDSRMGDYRYFSRLAAEMNGDGPECLMGYLLDEGNGVGIVGGLLVDGVGVGERNDGEVINLRDIPNTSALQQNKLITLEKDNPIGAWWLDRLKEGKVTSFIDEWVDEVPIRVLYADYERYAQKGRNRGVSRPTDVTFGLFFKRLLPSLNVVKRKSNLVKEVTILARIKTNTRQVRCYEIPSLQICREFFERKVLKLTMDWGN